LDQFLGFGSSDYVVILPWNLKEEITEQLQFIRQWGGCFVVLTPKLDVY